METSLKTGFAHIFSCCPKKSELPTIWGGCSPPRPPLARTPMISDHPSKCQSQFSPSKYLVGNSCYKQLLGTKKVSLGKVGRKTCWLMYRGGSYHLLSLLVFCYWICTCPCCCLGFNLSLCCLWPFYLSYVALLRQCDLSEFTLTVSQFF